MTRLGGDYTHCTGSVHVHSVNIVAWLRVHVSTGHWPIVASVVSIASVVVVDVVDVVAMDGWGIGGVVIVVVVPLGHVVEVLVEVILCSFWIENNEK